MRPHPAVHPGPRPVRRLGAALLLLGTLAASTVAFVGAVPAGATGVPDPFVGVPGTDPRLRYPMVVPVDGRVESMVGGGCPSARAHSGVDLSSPRSEPAAVQAAYPGFARALADGGDGYGLTVDIVHVGDGAHYLSRYAHLSTVTVPAEGRWVEQGEVIGSTGSSGNATTVHLHFEVRDAADRVVDINPAFRPCRRDVVAGTALTLDLPGLVSPTARAAAALAPNTWAATGVGPGATASASAGCRYWGRATDRGDDRCDAAGAAGRVGGPRPGVGVGLDG